MALVEESQHDLAATRVTDVKHPRNDGERRWALLSGTARERGINTE